MPDRPAATKKRKTRNANRLVAKKIVVDVPPVQMKELPRAGSQLPLLFFVWLLAAMLHRDVVDGSLQHGSPLRVVQQRMDVVHEGDIVSQFLGNASQGRLHGGVAGPGKAGDDGFRLLFCSAGHARHLGLVGLSPQTAAIVTKLDGGGETKQRKLRLIPFRARSFGL